MKNQLKNITETRKEIELEIPAEEAKTAHEKALQSYARKAKIKGFRKGMVPVDIVQRMYKAEIREAVINELIPEALNNELKSYNLKTAGYPRITDLKYEAGESIQVKAEVDIWPDFSIPDYKKIKLKKKKVSVTQKDIDESLKDIQERSVQYIPTENRGVVDGDYVVLEIKGRDKKTKRFLPTEKAVVLANHPDNEKQLNDRLIGVKAGEETSFSVNYKKDHLNKKLVGRNIDYKIKVLSIKAKKLPEINDDFAKELGEFDNLESLKKRIKLEIKENKEEKMKRDLAEDLIKKIADEVKMELPETIVEQEGLSILRRRLSSESVTGSDKEKLEKMKQEAVEQAKRNLKNHLILSRIAEVEKLEVAEKDYQEELKRVAEANNISLMQVKDSVDKEGSKKDIMDNLLIRKTIDFLVDEAIIK